MVGSKLWAVTMTNMTNTSEDVIIIIVHFLKTEVLTWIERASNEAVTVRVYPGQTWNHAIRREFLITEEDGTIAFDAETLEDWNERLQKWRTLVSNMQNLNITDWEEFMKSRYDDLEE